MCPGGSRSGVSLMRPGIKGLRGTALLTGSVLMFAVLATSAYPEDAITTESMVSQLAGLDGELARKHGRALLRLNLPKTSREAFRVYIGQATASLQAGEARRAAELLDEAENAGELADIDAFAAYLALKGDVSAALGEHETSVHHLQLAVEISRKRRDPYRLWRSLLYFSYALQTAGRVRAAMATHEEALAIATDRGFTWERTLSHSRAALGALRPIAVRLPARRGQGRRLTPAATSPAGVARTCACWITSRWARTLSAAFSLQALARAT